MTIAVTGPRGRLGSWLLTCGCAPLNCDITDPDSIREALRYVKPRTIINCAAWSAVDDAEIAENRDKVLAANTRGPGRLRQEFGGYLIHISTGFVFNGKSGPYDETETAEPLNFYGWSKLGGEAAALMRQPTLIVRTLDLFGPGEKSDFVRAIRDMLELGQPYALPANLYGSPTYIPHLANALLDVESKGLEGVLNICGNLVLSRHKWGIAIAEAFGYDTELIEPTDEIKGAAPRPLRGGLLTGKAERLGVPIYSPLDGLADLAEREHAA